VHRRRHSRHLARDEDVDGQLGVVLAAMKHFIYLCVLLAGCASQPRYKQIDYSSPPPEGWPALREYVTYGTREYVTKECKRNPANTDESYDGCALAYLDGLRCDIYLSSHDPELIKHERDHCKGYAHIGDAELYRREFWKWKYKQR
jgi:hypothetical protein